MWPGLVALRCLGKRTAKRRFWVQRRAWERLRKSHEVFRPQLLGARCGTTANLLEPGGRLGPRRDPRQLERVRQSLAAVREGAADDGLQARVVGGQLAAPAEGDERRVDVRPGTEHVPRHRMEAGPLGDELNENGHGPIRFGLRLGEEPVRDLTLHHDAPQVDDRKAVEALGDQRGRDVVRQVGDELLRRRLERAQIERERVAEVELHLLASGERLAEPRLERPVELDSVDVRDAVGEVDGQDAEPRADLEHDVGRVELGEPADYAEDVLVGEKVLSELPLRPRAQGEGVATESAKAAVAFASIRTASSAASSPRTSARAVTV